MGRKHVVVYTDGACSGNPGPGGWAAVMQYTGHRKELSGFEAETTNNRMEMLAVIRALEALKEPCDVAVHSDSAYLVNAFNQHWLDRWLLNGWRKTDKSPVENRDLWETLHALSKKHAVDFIKVAGHADVELNERCDVLAREVIRNHVKDDAQQAKV